LSFGNKNPEIKIKILFRTKESGIKNNTFQKKIQKRDYFVSEIKIQKQK